LERDVSGGSLTTVGALRRYQLHFAANTPVLIDSNNRLLVQADERRPERGSVALGSGEVR
jgi:hypothetical protein